MGLDADKEQWKSASLGQSPSHSEKAVKQVRSSVVEAWLARDYEVFVGCSNIHISVVLSHAAKDHETRNK